MKINLKECPLEISHNGCQIVSRSGSVRDFPEVGILECVTCGVTFHAKDLSLAVDYANGTMNLGETDFLIMPGLPDGDESRRGTYVREHFPSTGQNKVKVLDFGCGSGNLLKELHNDYDIEGVEIDSKARSFCKSLGFQVHESLDAVEAHDSKFDLITLIHVVEHLNNPVNILQRLAQMLSKNGRLIIETPNSNDALLTFYKCQAFQNWTYWSHHPILFNFTGISNLLTAANLRLIANESVQRYNLANHLYWLSQGEPGGHVKWKDFMPNSINEKYQDQLFTRKETDTIFIQVSN